MKAIVAIGGGKFTNGSRVPIDREIVRLSGKKHPRLLFIPTASSDSELYWQHISEYFGDFLKCRVDVLWLLKESPSRDEIKRKIFSADIIHVGGGNTLMMMRLWRRLGVDKFLRTAYEKGIVLSGASAGSICWFDSGHSDSMSFYNPKKWKYINVTGLGLVSGIHCPHYNGMTGGVPRRREFRRMIGKMGGVGIAIENGCAIEFIDGRFYRVIASRENARAYRFYRRRGDVVTEQIPQRSKRMPLESLWVIEPYD